MKADASRRFISRTSNGGDGNRHLRQAIRSVDRQAIVESAQTLEQVREDRVAPRKVNALLVTLFGGLAVVHSGLDYVIRSHNDDKVLVETSGALVIANNNNRNSGKYWIITRQGRR